MREICTFIVIASFICINGCVSNAQRQCNERVGNINNDIQNNNYYDAVNNAIIADRYYGCDDVKKYISQYASTAIDQMSATVTLSKLDMNSYEQVIEKAKKYTVLKTHLACMIH